MTNRVKSEPIRLSTSGYQSAEDREIEEWAKKLASRPPPQIGVPALPGGQPTIHSFFNLNSTTQQTTSDSVPPNNGFDVQSAIGKFTWYTISDDKYIPCIFRNEERYCCVRMVEISVIENLLRILPSELYDSIVLNTHPATAVEARLFNYINTWHCDGFFGSNPFTPNDLVVSLKDVEKYYTFLRFAYDVLSGGGRNPRNDFSKCGFIKVNNDNLIPFTVLSSEEKGVPLFYFEGQTDILKVKAEPLSGYELAYLKVCCKVQGVRKSLITGSTLQIVKVSDLRAYFPRRTVFAEDCWPTPKTKSLLPKSSINGICPGYALSPPVSFEKWTKTVPFPNKDGTISSVSITVPTPTSSANNSMKVATLAHTLSATPVVIPTKNGGATANNVTVSCNGVPTQIPVGKELHAKSAALRKIKVSQPPMDMSRLVNIKDILQPKPDAYSIKLIIIDKQLMHCINLNAHKSDTHLVVLQEFMNHFFPTVSIYPTAASVLKSCGVTTYLPNKAQVNTLNAFGFSIKHAWEIPLISAVEVTQAMPKLKNFFRQTRNPNSSPSITPSSQARPFNGGEIYRANPGTTSTRQVR